MNEKEALEKRRYYLECLIKSLENSEVVKKEVQVLIGKMTGSAKETSKFINSQYNVASKEFFSTIEKKLNELISDEVVDLINKTLEAYNVKNAIENEIAELKRELSAIDGTVDDYEKLVSLELDIEEKANELIEKEKVFKRLYLEALKKTTISSELAEMFNQISNIEQEEREQVQKEIKLQEAKLNALKELRIDLRYEAERLIEKRINTSVFLLPEKVIKSSNTKTPIIKKYFTE